MKKLKDVEEYISGEFLDRCGDYSEDIINAINLAQKESYNQAIDDAAENAKLKPDENQDFRLTSDEYLEYIIDKQSILKLKK